MIPSYSYHAFGLVIQTDLPLPELTVASTSAKTDVRITVGKIETGIRSPQEQRGFWKTAPGQLELNVPGTARYLATEGTTIQIEPAPDAKPVELRTILLGSVFGALLQQRGFFVLHSGGFVHRGGAVLICGRSGAGKSTVLQGMTRRGFASLSDDLVPISIDPNDVPIASPGYPFTRLCRDAATHYGLSQESPRFLAQSGQKLVLEINNFDTETRPISHIIFLRTHNRNDVQIELASPLQAGSLLFRIGYRSKFLRGMGLLASQFDCTIKIARKVPLSIIHRPGTLETLDHLLDRIETVLTQPSHEG